MKTTKRYYIYFGIVAALIFSSFFWGNPGQRWNMRQVRGEIRELKEILGDDVRFSEVKFLVSTANMGKNLYVDGTVADDETLADLRDLIEGEVAGKFSVVYWVKIKKDGD